VLAAALALAAVLYPTGWFGPALYPDTEGYLRAASDANPWGLERHPLYGWLLQSLDRWGLGRTWAPALQYALQAAAAMALAGAAVSKGLDRKAATALGLAALIGQSVVIWGRALLPEVPAVSLLLIAIALAMVAMRERLFWPAAVLIGLAFGTACILRPIVAPAVVMIPLLYLLLCRMDRQGWRLLRALAMAALMAAPLILQSAHRYREVGHFGIVSFGGFGSMGVAAQVLTPEIVPRLPDAQRALAVEVINAKERAVESQTAMPLFRNSTGERSFRATALDGFDALARNFDEILWGQLVTLRRSGESWVAFNDRMGALSAATMRAAPERYLFWTMGATSRLAGRLLVYNAAFLAAVLLFALAALWNIARYGSALAGVSGRGWTPLVLIVATWVVSTSALTVVAAFPALRYTDTAGLMLTALPLYGFLLALAKTKSAEPM
jgi:hypothetical protein